MAGAKLQIADALSRSPVSTASDGENDFKHEVSAYVNMLVQTLPATDNRLQEIQTVQENDPTCSQL